GGSRRDIRVGMHAERKVLEYEAHVVRCLDHGIERWTGRATRWALEVGKLDDGNGGVGRSLDGRIPDLDLLLGLVREARIVGGLDLAGGLASTNLGEQELLGRQARRAIL